MARPVFAKDSREESPFPSLRPRLPDAPPRRRRETPVRRYEEGATTTTAAAVAASAASAAAAAAAAEDYTDANVEVDADVARRQEPCGHGCRSHLQRHKSYEGQHEGCDRCWHPRRKGCDLTHHRVWAVGGEPAPDVLWRSRQRR